MLREFFLTGGKSQRLFAVSGFIIMIAYSIYNSLTDAWLLKLQANFCAAPCQHERTPMAPVAPSYSRASVPPAVDTAGNSTGIDDPVVRAGRSAELFQIIVDMAIIIFPWIIVVCAKTAFARVWQYSWRAALMKSYVAHWDPLSDVAIEGTAQRVHEDTSRFEQGLAQAFNSIIQAVATLLVFLPVLIKLGGEVHPPGFEWPPWLAAIALIIAIGATGISILVGAPLVGLEVRSRPSSPLPMLGPRLTTRVTPLCR